MRGLHFLNSSPRYFRSSPTRGESSETLRVEREGGREGAGLIRQASLIKRGEALGHGVWIDETFLDQVNVAAAAKEPSGLKARATHPGMSSDGFGTFLGRYHDFTRVGDKILGDLHFSQSSHSAKDNAREHTLDMAENDPDMLGLSIVFMPDYKAEDKFRNEHEEEFEEPDPWNEGETRIRRKFKSPDPLNLNNLPHARLASLRSADVVDEPAANDEGLSANPDLRDFLAQADGMMAWVLGLTDKPPIGQFDIDPNRARSYVQRFLSNRGLTLVDAAKKDNSSALSAVNIHYLQSQLTNTIR